MMVQVAITHAETKRWAWSRMLLVTWNQKVISCNRKPEACNSTMLRTEVIPL